MLLSLWAFLPCLFLIVEWTPVYIHYFIPSIPALALLMGFGVESLLRMVARWRPLQYALWLILVLILALQVFQWCAALRFIAERHLPYPGFTTPLAKLMPLRDALSAAEDVVVLAGGMAWNLHHEVAVWDALLWDAVACVRTIVPDGYAVIPGNPSPRSSRPARQPAMRPNSIGMRTPRHSQPGVAAEIRTCITGKPLQVGMARELC